MNILRYKTSVIPLFCLAAVASVAQSNSLSMPPAAVKAHVLVLGTFHMSNPGRDVMNMQVDDMLAPEGRMKSSNSSMLWRSSGLPK